MSVEATIDPGSESLLQMMDQSPRSVSAMRQTQGFPIYTQKQGMADSQL